MSTPDHRTAERETWRRLTAAGAIEEAARARLRTDPTPEAVAAHRDAARTYRRRFGEWNTARTDCLRALSPDQYTPAAG